MKNKTLTRILTLVLTIVVIPALFFIAFEGILRLVDYGYSPDFFMKQEINGKEYYVNNYKFSWRFFPKPMARLSASVLVPVEKDKDALRVFVVGESAAMGDPEPAFSFSRQLMVMLEKKYPSKKIEVYNTAVTAINSNVIVPIVRDCLKLKPDAFIVYMGNNEVIGPYGLSAALTPFFSNRFMIKTQIRLGETRLGQLFKDLATSDEINNQEWKGMELFMKNKIRFNDPDLQIIYNHYQENLNEICSLATNAGSAIILASIITNERDCAPFLSLHDSKLKPETITSWAQLYKTAINLDSAGEYQTALPMYEKAYLLDSTFAELNFRMGKCLLTIGQRDKAEKYFINARDHDALRFRSDSRMYEIVQNVAATQTGGRIFYADAVAFAKTQSKDQIPGNDILYEHVHLNFKGNNLLAKAVLLQTEKALNLKEEQRQEVPIMICRNRLAYTAFDEKRINEINLSRIQAAPFTNQITNHEDVSRLQKEVQFNNEILDSTFLYLINKTYTEALSYYPTDWFIHLDYLKFLFEAKKYSEAASEARLLYTFLPYEYLACINMGITQKQLKNYPLAEHYLFRAININPYFSEAYKNIALLYEDERQFYKAGKYFERGRCSASELTDYYNRTGVKFAKQDVVDSAILYFEKAVSINPHLAVAQKNLDQAKQMKNGHRSLIATPEFSDAYNKGNTFFKQRKYKDAILYYKRALELNPSFAKAENNTAIAFIQLREYNDAIVHFKAALKIDPGFIDVYPNLAQLLESQGRLAEAIDVLKAGVIQKQDPYLYQQLAALYSKSGNVNAANACLLKEKEMNSHSVKQ